MPQQGSMPWEQNWDTPVDIEATAKKYGLDPQIITRQVHQESGGNQSAVSPKGAIGMMQLMPETAKRLGVDPYNKKQNVEGGMQEMARLVKKYGGDYSKALAAYNAGEGPVDKAGGVPDYPETQNYVKSIMGAAPQTPAAPWERNWATPQATPERPPEYNKGDVRPSASEMEKEWRRQKTEEMTAVFYGRMIPDAAVPALAAINKYAVQPFEKMSQFGAEVGSEAMRIAALHAGITGPKGQGVAAGLGELAGGTVADPRMWPFALEGAAKGALSRLAAKGFGMQMLWHAATTLPEAREAIKNGDDYNAARLITNAIASGLLATSALHEPISAEERVQRALQKAQKTAKGTDSALNEAIKRATLTNKSTPMGPVSQTGGQDLQVKVSTNAPIEAQAPAATGGASQVASAPTVDRQALIAPKPADYVGAETPVPAYRFPKGTIEGMPKGETIGMPPVDIRSQGPYRVEPSLPAERIAELSKRMGRQVSPSEALELDRLELERRSAAGEGVPKAAEPAKPQPPPVFGATFDTIADLKRQADLAEREDRATNLTNKADQLERGMLGEQRKWMESQPDVTLQQYMKLAEDRATKLEAQSKAMRDLTESTIKNRSIKEDITERRAQGGPPRYIKDPVTGEYQIDEQTGRPSVATPENLVTPEARAFYDQAMGRVPSRDYPNPPVIKSLPKGVGEQEGIAYLAKLIDERSQLRNQMSDAIKDASERGISLADTGVYDLEGRFNIINDLLQEHTAAPEEGKTVGRRPNIPAEVDENGAIKAPELLPSWSKERQDMALDAMGFGKPRGMLTDEELFQHADMGQEKGRLFRSLAATAKDVLDTRKREGQAGFLGEGPKLRGKVEPVSLKDRVPEDKEMQRRAFAAKLNVKQLSDDNPMGVYGWVAPNGKWGIELGSRETHASVAEKLMPEVVGPPLSGSVPSRPKFAMLDAGWVRIASPISFEAWNLDAAKGIIKDTLERNGRFGAAIDIDTRTPDGRTKTLSFDSGWEDFNRAFMEANKRSQIGALRGTTLAGSATVGGLVGAAVGAHLGDPYAGLAIGLTSGFLAPAVMDHPAFQNAIGFIRGPLDRFGISMKEWIAGPRQEPSTLPEMDSIRDAQKRDLQNPARSFVTRLAQLPADLERRWLDRFGMVNDNPSAFGKWLKQWDTRNPHFRDLRGKLDVDNSPYIGFQLAANGGSGLQEVHMVDYKNVLRTGQKAGLLEHLANFLNLKGYSRAWQVMQERVQEGATTQAKLEQALKQSNLPVEVEAGLKRQLRETKADLQDVQDKIANKQVAPEQFDPPKIADSMQRLQQTLGPDKFAQVQNLANKVFQLNRQVLDLAHDEGIIGDEEYQKYIGRGDEYIPMHRILERVNEANGDWYGRGNSNPLYLRTSNMIKALTGSEKVNRDPITASADANMRALREITRNRAITDMLKLAQADPQGVGSYFKQVRQGYQAGPDKGIVGAYVNGQQVSFEVPSWLSETLKNVAPSSLDVLGKGPLQFFSNIMRRGATVANLGWSIPNAIRHLEDMALMSDAGLKSFNVPKDVKGLTRDYIRSIYSVIQQDGVWREAVRSGALGGNLQRAISPEKSLDLNSLGFRQKVAGLRLVDLTADFNRSVEDVVKTTTYRRLRENGLSEKAAAWETRRYGGGPDFAQMGTDMPVLNLLSMFFNAHMQYLGRAFTRIAEQPMRMGVALFALTAMNMALVQHNAAQKDSDGQPLMRRIDKATRENYWTVLSGDTYKDTGNPVAYRFPKPSFAKFFSNPIENMLYKVAGVEQRNGVQLGLQALSDMAPGQVDLQQGKLLRSTAQGMFTSLNPALRTPIEEFANYSTRGRGGPIVPEREQQLSTPLQYGPQTSQVAREIGQGGWRGAVVGAAEGGTIGYLLAGPQGGAIGGGLGSIVGTYGISPRRAEHIIDTTTAGVGRIATSFVDPFLGGVQQTRTGPSVLSTPVVGPIAGRFISPNINQVEVDQTTKFYDQVKQAKQPLQDMEFLQKNRPQELGAYMQGNAKNIAMGKLAEGMERQMAKYNSMQRMIENNQNMNPDAKNESLKNLHAMRVKLMTVFNDAMKTSPQVGQAAAFPGQGQGAPR